MKAMKQRRLTAVYGSTGFQVAVVVALALLLGNVNPLVDSILHPEIPYFDREHLVVGGATALVSATLSFLLVWYEGRLSRAVEAINRLEAILPICSNCKKIRRSGADPDARESWQSIDSYITEKTRTEFSHGICPACLAALYPEHVRDLRPTTRSND